MIQVYSWITWFCFQERGWGSPKPPISSNESHSRPEEEEPVGNLNVCYGKRSIHRCFAYSKIVFFFHGHVQVPDISC